MQRARVEERRGAAAETAALVELVKPGDPGLTVALLIEHQAHRNAEPEVLGRLNPAGRLAGLVDDQVAIVERLDAQEVEFQIRRGVEDRGESGEIVIEEAGIEPLDGDAVLEVLAEAALMRRL